ncbi:WD40 repeat-like protein [Gloeophyllum trabeum ATCC 11539]|uniref:WD40 repeat-like protein n=1 Tax=Gloeophyllum trabeum (strain ATCC 11539 / FP-39264 / Madison 617) TaxID=670483 RepID=S7RI60_GLOTA|nr:WD40 repeat-like protein [Gloeophyllum trabeum ATCC 11539]EPQ52299.1 WD40 repeat-like protein [Gloeophyllum trabeum ATCC 11539]
MVNTLRVDPPPVTPNYTNDLTVNLPNGPGSVTPTRTEPSNKRKQTLLSLLDALTELTKDEDIHEPEGKQTPTYDDNRDVPNVDEDQVVGAESFYKFQRRVLNLDKELRNFANSARQLGSSVGILSSSFHLRERLVQILFLFRENAADLFPRKVTRQSRDALVNPNSRYTRKRVKRKAPHHIVRPAVFDNLDPEDFPAQLEMFAKDVMTFLKCLNEFPEFQDEAVNASIKALHGDLKYWASCLKAYDGQFRYPAVQRYLHDLTSEMGEHLESLTSNLCLFIEVGVPTIRFAQKHAASNLLNLSTVATFFSAVTATTLQYSYESTGTILADMVNAFWFTSMVFSIGAAVNSLLGVTWKQAMYRSPGNRVPWWVLIWIKRSPLVFLVISVACFSVGLVLFTYSTLQNRVVCTITTVFTAFSSFGLAAVSAWVASERWIFARHKGQKWLADVLDHLYAKIAHYTGIKWLRTTSPVVAQAVVEKTREPLRRASTSISRIRSWTLSALSLDDDKSEPDTEQTIRVVVSPEHLSPNPPMSPSKLVQIAEHRETHPSEFKQPASENGQQVVSEKAEAGPSTVNPKRRFANAVRSVMMMQTASSPMSSAFRAPRRARTLSSSEGSVSRGNPGPFSAVRRVAALSQRLKSLDVTQELQPHHALVRHLQFSPDGRFLATSSWDRTSMIFRVEEGLVHHRTLAHPQGFVGQAAWSPTGHLLLTKLNRSVKIWTQDGVCRKTIDRHRAIHSVAWFPGGEAFMSVEGSSVIKLDLAGKIHDSYDFDRLNLHDVSVTPDCKRLLGVGTLIESADGLKPSKSRAEKQIIVYNLEQKEVENQVPVLHDVRDITLAKSGKLALVSYEDKAPPQLWRLETVKAKDKDADIVRLSLRHTYMPKIPVDFAGPSYFGGKDDQLIFCAGKAGDIHIWDRDSGELLHYLRASQGAGGDLTSIAWNQGSDTFMFATGSHDGYLKIWTPADYTLRGRQGTPGPTGSGTVSRSDSPYGIPVEVWTDSPAPLQQEFDAPRTSHDIFPESEGSQDGFTAESSFNGSTIPLIRSREKSVSFARYS